MEYVTGNHYLEAGQLKCPCSNCGGELKQMFGKPCFVFNDNDAAFAVTRKFYCKKCAVYHFGVMPSAQPLPPQLLRPSEIESESDFLDVVKFTCQTKYQYNFWKKHLFKSGYDGEGLLWFPEVFVEVEGRSFFLDFLNLQTKIAIELDDASHKGSEEKDRQRDLLVKSLGITTVRLNI